MKYTSDITNGQIAIVSDDGRAVCFIPYLHPDSEQIKKTILHALNTPSWYDAKEMHRYLKMNGYSDLIADELCADYANNLQLAYEKGMAQKPKDVNDINVVDTSLVVNPVREAVEAYIKKCNYTHTYEDILMYYNEYYIKGHYVSHTTKDVIRNSLLPAMGNSLK
jgi:hypothetical protein